MSRPTRPELPDGYPDPSSAGWVRIEDLEIADLHIRMTVAPGERIVQLWELVDGEPTRWLGNVYRVDSEPPCLRLDYHFEKRFKRSDREVLARKGAKFWKI